ncbi:DNA replication complex GINS protein sld5 [Trametes pubescens]|uniref:AA9 family lytic polysaccharide monooxygenase n=1 Tax=Trametes pubescens TaxID=154538 RepID=A0A1M2VE30_TRAPU|nr:DNA replication complex GINS protein sld5 [Trametes pubescens]
MATGWDDDFDAPMAGPSFVDRARIAPDDDDFPIREGRPGIIPQDLAEETPFQQLIRHWMNERHAPDILPGQEMLLGRLLDHIRKQSNDVELLRADPDSSEEEHFRIMLVQTEVERVKFVIRSYIRTRLHKIEKHARYISSTPDIHEKLSKAELDHARRYSQLVEYHFNQSVLQSLPEQQRSMEDNVAFMPPMTAEPDKLRPVFAHALQDCPPMRLPETPSGKWAIRSLQNHETSTPSLFPIMLPSLRSICALLALAALADAHGYVRTLTIDGKSYQGNPPREQQPVPIDSPIRQIATTSPITSTTDPNLACGLDVQPAALTVPAHPGSNISIDWASTEPPPSYWFHNVGPIMIYIASCEGTPCAQTDGSTAKWAKIAQAGQKVKFSKSWVQGDLMTGQPYSFSLPDNLKSGGYLLRPEIIALQGAMSGDVEFYVTCIQLNVTGNGNGVPNTTVSFPGAYSPDDAGIKVDVSTYSPLLRIADAHRLPQVYGSDLDYVFPGGPIASFVSDDGDNGDAASETTSSSQPSASQPSSSASGVAQATTSEATTATSTSSESATTNPDVAPVQATTAQATVPGTSEAATASTTDTTEQAVASASGCTCAGATTTAPATTTVDASKSSTPCDDTSETSAESLATPSTVVNKQRRRVFPSLVRQRMLGRV